MNYITLEDQPLAGTTNSGGKPMVFPQDELAHNQIIEWWYFNGHLFGRDGREYAFMSCLFKADARKVKIPFLAKVPAKILYFYHSIISDISQGKWYPMIEPVSLISQDSFSRPRLFINHTGFNFLAGYTNCVIEETGRFAYRLKDKAVDLELISNKNPLLVGGDGFLDLKTKTTYYYSLTNLKTRGRIKLRGRWLEVSGKSWMDHQWADAAYSKDKWTWFSLQLDNDTEMVCFVYEDQGRKNYLASVLRSDGRQEHFKEIVFTPLGTPWISPKTGAAYPLAWKIKVPGGKIDLEARALIKEQEMIYSSINYWEGPIKISGRVDRKEVTGRGFMELVGYESKYTNAKYVKDELGKIISKIFSYTRKNVFISPAD